MEASRPFGAGATGLFRYRHLLWRYARPVRWRAALMVALVLVGLGLQLASPQVLRYFIDVARGQAPGNLLALAALFFAVAALEQVSAVASGYATRGAVVRATNRMRSDLARHCLGLDMGFHDSHTPGEMIQRLDGDVGALASFLMQLVIVVGANGLLLLGIIALLFGVHWLVGTSLALFVFLSLLLLLRLRFIAVPHWVVSEQAEAELYGYLEERLAGTRDIRALGAVPYVVRRFHVFLGNAYRKALRASVMSGITYNAATLLFAVGTAVGLFAGAWLYHQREITLGTAFMVFYYATMLAGPIQMITIHAEHLQNATASIVRIRQLAETRSRVPEGPGLELAPGPLSVELDHVTFGYDPEHPVLRDVSLGLEPGRTLGLLGRTGHGKTTIARLEMRLYDPQEGAVRLGGRDLRQSREGDLARHVGMVTQNVQLFRASVRDNLTFFDPSVPDEKILGVLEDLGLGRWYRSLPSGLDTALSSGGGGLSAGEAQLLAFARVFLRDPGLVILDEPTSRVDPATEGLIERAVERLLEGRTAIVIAHRLATVARVDEIAIVEGGRVVERGEREALARDPASRFHRLLRVGGDLDEVMA